MTRYIVPANILQNLDQRAKNFAASFALLTAVFLAYRFLPDSSGLVTSWFTIFQAHGSVILGGSYVVYALLLLVFYFTEGAPKESKSIAALRGLKRLILSPRRVWRDGLPYTDRLGLLTVLLKGFFAPLMIMSLFAFTDNLINNGSHLIKNLDVISSRFLEVFNTHGFWFLFQIIVFVDVIFFTVGYLVEHPRLGNEIRSVDPTLLGWGVALACYPPFNGVVASVLGWTSTEFPQFADPAVHITMNFLLLGLMGIYASASVALNLKASNLTHRGIISHGPYRYVRHPAYICKNLAWWIGIFPATFAAWEASAWAAMQLVAAMAAWSGIYALRALTEEDHLRKVDDEYNAYCKKVRYRFIPGLY